MVDKLRAHQRYGEYCLTKLYLANAYEVTGKHEIALENIDKDIAHIQHSLDWLIQNVQKYTLAQQLCIQFCVGLDLLELRFHSTYRIKWLSIATKLPILDQFDISVIIMMLLHLGIAVEESGDPHAALSIHINTFQIIQKYNLETLATPVLGIMGQTYKKIGASDWALNCYKLALEISKRQGDCENQIITLYELGLLCVDYGDIKDARDYFQAAVNLAGKSFMPELLYARFFLEKFQKPSMSMEYLYQALENHHKYGEHNSEAKILGLEASFFAESGNIDDAFVKINAAQKLYERNANLEGQIYCLNFLSSLFIRQADFANALKCGQESLDLNRGIYPRHMALCMLNIGNAYFATGLVREALKNYIESLETFWRILDHANLESVYQTIINLPYIGGAFERIRIAQFKLWAWHMHRKSLPVNIKSALNFERNVE